MKVPFLEYKRVNDKATSDKGKPTMDIIWLVQPVFTTPYLGGE